MPLLISDVEGLTTGRKIFDLAIQDFNSGLNLEPDNASAYVGRGRVYDSKGDHDFAIQDFSAALTLKPDYAAGLPKTCKSSLQRG